MENFEIKEKIKSQLSGKKAGEIIKAAKYLQKNPIEGIDDLIVGVLRSRYESNQSWEAQANLIKAIEAMKIEKAVPFLEEIVNKNEEYDTVTNAAASAYFRLIRKDLKDVTPIKSRYGILKLSVGDGMLNVLGEDKMIPPEEDQESLISYFWDFGSDRPRGVLDPRFGLVLACANWHAPGVKGFLQHCSRANDSKLTERVKMILKKNYY